MKDQAEYKSDKPETTGISVTTQVNFDADMTKALIKIAEAAYEHSKTLGTLAKVLRPLDLGDVHISGCTITGKDTGIRIGHDPETDED